MSKKRDQKKREKTAKFWGTMSGIAAFIGVFQLLPAWGFFTFFIALALASSAKALVTEMLKGLDLTTHNRQDEIKRAQEAPPPPSGDTLADETIAKGIEMLKEVQRENEAIPDEVLSHQMDELNRLCMQIFSTIAEKPNKAPQIRKFINYYLPTTLKMIRSYRIMEQRGVSSADLTNARKTLIRGISMVLTASQKQLDSLYKDDMLDVSTDITVLEQMLKRDGLTQGEFMGDGASDVPILRPVTAASTQMSNPSTPVLNTELDSSKDDDDFVSYYGRSSR